MKNNKKTISTTTQQKPFFRKLMRILLALLAAVCLTVGLAIFVMTAPAHISALGMQIDQSASVGGPNFVNHTLPYAAQIIAKTPSGTFVQVQSVGGARDGDVLYSGALKAKDSPDLRAQIAALKISSAQHRGSNVSLAVLNMAKSLARIKGGRKVIFYEGDGLDDNPDRDAVATEIKTLNAKDFVVCLLFTRVKNPLVAQAMEAAGAKVIIVQDPKVAGAAIDTAIYGSASSRRLRSGVFAFFCLLSLLSLAALFVSWSGQRAVIRRAQAEKLAQEALARKQAEELQKEKEELEKKEEIHFAPETCDLAINLGNNRIFRKLTAGNGVVAIASESCLSKVDLTIPNKLLTNKNVIATMQLKDDGNLLVRNRGEAKILVDRDWVNPKESVILRIPGEIHFGPDAIVTIDHSDAENLQFDSSGESASTQLF